MIISNDFRSNTLDKVWLKRYPADVPAEIDADRYSSLIEMFEHAVQAMPISLPLSTWAR